MPLLSAAARSRNIELSVQREFVRQIKLLDPVPVWLSTGLANINLDEENKGSQDERVGNEGEWKFDVWIRLRWETAKINRSGLLELSIRAEGRVDIDPRGHLIRVMRDDVISVMNEISREQHAIYDYGQQKNPIADDEAEDTGIIFWLQGVKNARTRDDIEKQNKMYGVIGWEIKYEIYTDAKNEFHR